MKLNLQSKLYHVLFFVILLAKTASATHVQGGDLTYTCLGGNQYQVRLALYRDCAGIAAPNSATINYSSASCNISTSVTLNKVPGTGVEVTPICSSLQTQCSGGTFPGVQEYIYTGIVTLPPCKDWVISYTISARNGAINTIVNPLNQNMYIEATLDNLTFPCNTSPTFTNKPVPFICVGQPFCFNNGSKDADGDSLSYSLVVPMNNPGSYVTYIAPYTASQPLTSSPPATFNPLTGDMCVTPSSIQVTVFAVLVQEWRNGVLVGSVTRDIQVRTITCTNNNPYLNGINNTGSYTINACAGTPLTFNIPSFDADAPQNVTLTWNSGISGATFNPGTGTRPTGTFSWTPTTADISNVSHCFTVKVKDDNCPFNGSQTYSFCINVGGITTTATSTNATCTAPNGSATINANGGVPPLVYNWSPSVSTTATANNLVAGTYTYTVTDTYGCAQTGSVTVNATPGGTAGISSFKNVSCFGLSNGAITVSTGGNFTAPFTYSWSPSSVGFTNSISNLSAGTYSVTVTDVNGCTAAALQTITQPAVLTLNPTFTNVGCNGGSSGTATGAVTGGTGPYSYLWMPGAFTTSSITSLPIGTYSLSVTDSKGCSASSSVTITQPPILTITSTPTSANCGQSNGSATVTGSGGFAPYTWTWSNGQTGTNATGLSAGTYVVTITDVNLCTQKAAVTIGNIAGPTATISTFTNVSCNGGNNGNATISVSGGTPPFTYLWSNGQITPTASNLGPGIYTVNAKDAAGCVASTKITITQPPLLVTNIVKTNPVCFGNSDGTVLASAVGGTPPYTFVWTTPGSPTTASVTGLSAGTYNVTVTDSKGCIKTQSITLTNPVKITSNTTVTPVSCNGGCNGTATVSSSGIAPFTYIWNSPVNQFTATATNLCAGSYTVSVTDANGCTSKAVATITQPTALTSKISSSGNLTCYGTCIGFAQVVPAGGSTPYTYNWSPGSATSALATNLCAGTYSCTVTDSKGCTSVSTVTITQPPQLVATVTGTNINCFGTCDGTGTINFSGGIPPYTFLWTPGLQKTFNPANLCTGVNTATVTDANGCKVTGSVTLTQAYTPLTVSATPTNSNCGQSNGSVCASASGGLAPYSYIWNDSAVTKVSCANSLPAGTYSVIVTDANGCVKTQVSNINDVSGPNVSIVSHTDLLCYGATNATATTNITGGILPYTILWTPGGQTVASPTNLAGGVNTITVKDSAGCTSSTSVTILEPPPIAHAITSTTNISCFNVCNGSATLMASGGTGSLTYLWSDPSAQTGTIASNLCAGKYKVITKDGNGCTVIDTAIIITQPTALSIANSTIKNITCFGDNDGAISTTAAGGTPFYTYSWTPNISSSPFASGLSAGFYSLTVTDKHGCSAIGNWTITQPTVLKDTTSFSPTTCSKANGSAGVTASGGTAPYTYQWNDPALQTIPSITNLFAGSYSILVTDAHGCNITKNVIITDQAGPTIDSITSISALCYGGSTGIATVFPTANTGTSPLTYLWTPGTQNLATASGLSKGVYNVTITDANGCKAIGTVVIKEPPLLELFVSPNDTICYGAPAQVYGQASGGTPAYTYTWSGAGTGLTGTGPHVVTPTTTSSYSLTVTDSKGCSAGPKELLVVVRPQLTVTTTNISICDGASGTISASASGGTGGPYTYVWSNGASTQSQTVTTTLTSSPASYTVTVSDGCSINTTGIAIVTVNPKSVGIIFANDTIGCEPLTVVFTAASNNGITYNWDFGDGSAGIGSPVTHTYLSSGKYTVKMTIITAAGCTTQIVKPGYITVNPTPKADFTTTQKTATIITPTVNFFDASTPVIKWSWDFGDPLSIPKDTSTKQNPIHRYLNKGIYDVKLIVTNQFGCMDTVIKILEIKDDFVFYAPNAFTPNGDQNNEIFLPKGVGWDITTFNLMIFDRWGNLIYQTDDYLKGWDGRANGGSDVAQIDTYVWKVYLKDFTGKEHKYIGHVSIIK